MGKSSCEACKTLNFQAQFAKGDGKMLHNVTVLF